MVSHQCLCLCSTCLPAPYVSWLKELRGNVEDKAILLPSTADFQVGENGQEPKCPGHWHSTQVYTFL